MAMIAPVQVRELSRLSLDLGKIVFAAAVVGFFVPGFSGDVHVIGVVIGTLMSVLLFGVGIRIAA